MKAYQPLVLAVLLTQACKASSERVEPAGKSVEATGVEQPAQPSTRGCNTTVTGARTAIMLAERAKRAGGFPGQHEVEGPKALVEKGFLLSPMVPSQWPPTDCTIVFYVSETKVFVANSVHVFRAPVAARITIELDTGQTTLTEIEDAPGLGGELFHGGGGSVTAAHQEWVFDAVASSSLASPSPRAISRYKSWLQSEEYVAAALFVWHRDFFDFVVGEDEELLRQVEVNSRVPARRDHRPPH